MRGRKITEEEKSIFIFGLYLGLFDRKIKELEARKYKK